MSPRMVQAVQEARRGFTLVRGPGGGRSPRGPREGDTPQVWVEVDLTPPTVTLFKPVPGRDKDSRTLTIGWHAADKNLADRPISLFWSESDKPGGRWTPIAESLENKG